MFVFNVIKWVSFKSFRSQMDKSGQIWQLLKWCLYELVPKLILCFAIKHVKIPWNKTLLGISTIDFERIMLRTYFHSIYASVSFRCDDPKKKTTWVLCFRCLLIKHPMLVETLYWLCDELSHRLAFASNCCSLIVIHLSFQAIAKEEVQSC